MGKTVDIGTRIELVPMDPHFHDITIGLYRQKRQETPVFLVHTYSPIDGASERIEEVISAMSILGGMDRTPEGLLRFPCGAVHELACKRIFLEACKLDPNDLTEPRPLNTLDKRAGLDITVRRLEDAVYQVTADGESKSADKRISSIAGGLMKLGQMEEVEGTLDRVFFSCGHAHDAMVGLLLVRAPNVRAILREQEMTASRGVLSAPSQQR